MEVRAFGTVEEACAKALRQVEACQRRGTERKTVMPFNTMNKREYGVIEAKKVGKDWTI